MNWEEKDNQLIREFKFSNFQETIGFMVQAAFIIEQQNHHPSWENTYNKLLIKLTTHDEGDVVTKKDRDLAKALDALFENFS